jgi:hypothetical protein
MKKQRTIALFAAPALVLGSVYAFAANSSEQDAASSVGISHAIVDTQPLTAEELQQVASAEPVPAPVEETNQPEGSVPRSVLDAANPFVVQQPTAPDTNSSAPAVSTGEPSQEFQLALVKKLELKSNTAEGELKIQFEQEDDGPKLDGEIGDRDFEVKGAVAEQFLTQLLYGLKLNQALTATLQGQQVHLDPKVLAALEEVTIELKDGRKIKSKGHSPKAEAQHDNGLHKGWEKGKGHGEDDEKHEGKHKKDKKKDD